MKIVGSVIAQAITDIQIMGRQVKETTRKKNKDRQKIYNDAYDFIFNGERLSQFLDSYGFKYLEIEYLRRKTRELILSKKSLRTDIFNGANNYNRKAA